MGNGFDPYTMQAMLAASAAGLYSMPQPQMAKKDPHKGSGHGMSTDNRSWKKRKRKRERRKNSR